MAERGPDNPFQVTHFHAQYGDLLRVFDWTGDKGIPICDYITDAKVILEVFFPVGSALRRGIVSEIAKCAVRSDLANFPIFRNGTPHPATRRVETWWLWDGVHEWRAGTNDHVDSYPDLGVVNDTRLIDLIDAYQS